MTVAVGLHPIGQAIIANETVIDYDSASDAIFAAFTTPPTTARKGLIDNVVLALKAAGLWTKIDWLYGTAAADSQAAKINWKNPGTYNCTEVNAPSFTADRGFTGASTKYLDTGFNPTTASTPNYVQNSACGFAFCVNDTGATGALIGNTSGSIHLLGRTAGNNAIGRVNNTANLITVANSNAIGLYSITRSGASAQELFKNGTSLGSNSGASLALTNGNIWLLRSTTVYTDAQIGFAGLASHLNSTEQTALYNAINPYMVGVGVV